MEAIPRKFSPDELAALNAASIQQSNKEFDARNAASEMALRQWCVEQATKVPLPSTLPTTGSAAAIVVVAADIFDFVCVPLRPEAPK